MTWTLFDIGLVIVLALLLPLVLWAKGCNQKLKDVHDMVVELLQMHKEPDQYEFGTGATNLMLKQMMEENARAMRELIHYMKWYVEETTGKKPEPYMDAKKD